MSICYYYNLVLSYNTIELENSFLIEIVISALTE